MNVNQIKNPDQNIRQRPLIFLDLETTGFLTLEHEIIEIGALKVDNAKPFPILDTFEMKVKPTRLDRADPSSLKVVGFKMENWEYATDLKDALEKLETFGEGGVLVGYNVSFDWAALNKAYHDIGKIDPFYYHRVDVMSMAFAKLYNQEKLKRFSLGEICRFLDIKQGNKHSALSDIKDTYEVFKKLMDMA